MLKNSFGKFFLQNGEVNIQISRYILKYMKSNMYVLIAKNQALIIDPHISKDLLKELNGKKIERIIIILTHEHFDHTCGVNILKENFSVTLICHLKCAEKIIVAKNNRPLSLLKLESEEDFLDVLAFYKTFPLEAIKADCVFKDYYTFNWMGNSIKILSMPGHSIGSALIEVGNNYVFSGDYMIPNEPVILRYPGGSEKIYRQNTLPFLLSIEDDKIIMPGHGNPYLRANCIYKNDSFVIYES